MKYAIINGKIVTAEKILTDKAVIIEDGKIAEISDRIGRCKVYDACGRYVLPGFVDIHLHGGGGCDFMDGTAEAFHTILKTHASHGTTSIAPTTVACDLHALYRLFDVYRDVSQKTNVRMLGIHLEGPFISKEMKGAQAERYIIEPTQEITDEILFNGKGIVSRISGAPEISGMQELAEAAKAAEITLAIAHSSAVAQQVEEAYHKGFRHITHMYCSTPSVHKVNQTVYAGVIEAAYLNDAITVELIGDGKHIPKEVMQLALKIKGAKGVALITDAMRAAGENCTESYLGAIDPKNKVIIEDGVAKLPDRSSFAGSIATSDMMFKNAVINYELPICAVSRMMSLTPAEIIGADDKIGSVNCGKYADLVIMNDNFKVCDVFVSGESVL